MEHGESLAYLTEDRELLRAIELTGPHGQVDARKDKKLREVAGFCDIILRYVREHLAGQERIRVAEFSCGKSYLGIVLAVLLERLEERRVSLVGVDVNQRLVEKCRRLAEAAGVQDARYVAGRTLQFEGEGEFDLAIALHACDTATDEAIARGIQLGVRLILVVPCCQNQIRGQIKGDHPLAPMTDFGPVRYRLANLLTDTLRAQFLRSAGYQVKMLEIGSPRLTPKNLCICARRKRRGASPRDSRGYVRLRSLFGVSPKIERYCPGIVPDSEG